MPYVPESPMPETTPPSPETLVEAHLDLARKLAGRYAKRHPANRFDDAHSDALLGLWEAARNYDPSLSSFRTHARNRILGAMIDGIRERDQIRRSTGLPRLSRALSLSYSRPRDGSDRDRLVADAIPDPKAPRPDADPVGDCLHLLRGLSPLERRAMLGVFVEGLPMRVVGEQVGLSASRISQMISDACAWVREECPERHPAAA